MRRAVCGCFIGYRKGIGQHGALGREIIAMRGNRFIDRLDNICSPSGDGSGVPVKIAGIVAPIDTMRVEMQARARAAQEFIHLAADVSDIYVRSIGIAHIGRGRASLINQQVRARRQRWFKSTDTAECRRC